MELIDIDPLKERIDKEVKEGKVLDGWAFFFKAYLDSEPIIDIVRCKECQYWNTKGCRDGVGECEWAYYMTKPDDFCSYGEREDK